MQKILTCITMSLLVFSLAACYKTSDKMGNNSNEIVLAYPAVKNYNVAAGGLNYWSKGLLSFDLSKATASVKVSVNLADGLESNVPLTLGVDQMAFDAYNNDTSHHTKYALMPADYYKIENENISLIAGTTDTAFNITFYPSKFDISATGYLLPVSITTGAGHPVSQQMKTVYFHIEKDPFPPYSRSNWTVTGFSSEEASGEGPNNGRVVHMLDNDPSTFWHSQWQGAVPPAPHWFSFDMAEPKIVHGVMFLGRQGGGGNNRPKDVNISVSNDGVAWTSAANITLANTDGWQKIPLSAPTQAVRYLKVTINTLQNATSYSYLAEFKVY